MSTLFVCQSCAPTSDGSDGPGKRLLAALTGLATSDHLKIAPVDCLAVCKRPCTVALTGDGKWTYVIGDLDPALHAEEVLAGATAYAQSDNGIVAWRLRPQSFRKGVIARVPPLGFVQPDPEGMKS